MTENDSLKASQLLQDLKLYVDNGTLSKEQILAVLTTSKPTEFVQKKGKINLQKILYYIGGFILLLGIIFYIGQYWNTMSQITRTIITLGASVSTYFLGYYFYTRTKNNDFGHSFLIISSVLFPLGIGTALDMLGVSPTTSSGISVNAALLFIIYSLSFYSIKAKIFLLFTFIAGTTLFFSFTNFMFLDNGNERFYEYRLLIMGLTYLSFGYYFTNTNKKFMTNLLYFFGLFILLSSALSLQGFTPANSIVWEILYPFLLVGIFYSSVKLQNNIFLILGTLFTFGEILKLTYEYFSNSLGWPISLMLAGLLMMGIGYVSFELNRKYLKIAKA